MTTTTAWSGIDPTITTDGLDYELANTYVANQVITVSSLRIFGDTTTFVGRKAMVWDVATQALLRQVILPNTMPAGWSEYALSSPLTVQPGTRFLVAYLSNGDYPAALNALAADVLSADGHVTALAAGGVFDRRTSAVVYPTGGSTSHFYGTDFVYTLGDASGNTAPTATLSVAPGSTPLTVTASVAVTDNDTTGMTYEFDWGDGSANVLLSTPSASHTYMAAGTFAVAVTVRDNGGLTSTATAVATVESTPPTATAPQPYYVRGRQSWAVDQERQRHTQALWTIGESSMFALMWHIQDFQAGLVGRCQRCAGTAGSVQSKIADVYKQPTQNRCPDCFGTTFEGGYRALIIRPAIFSDTDESETFGARGVVHPDNVDVESTTDFRVRTGDYVFRANGDRFRLGVPQRITLRTGYGMPHQSDASIGYNHARAAIEDPNASVAYEIGPSKADLLSILAIPSGVPLDYSQYETIRGPLIPAGD